MLEEEYNYPPENFVKSVRNGVDDAISKKQTSTEKGDEFLKWVLTKAFHASDDDAEISILDGPNDQGIDAILEIHGSEMNFFRIIQSKYGKSHSVDAIRAFKSKIEDLLKQKPNDLPPGRIRDALIQIKNKDWDVEAVYVTDQIVDFKNEENFQILGFNQIVEKLWNEITEPAAGKTETVELEYYLRNNNTIIGAIALGKLGHFVRRTRKYIFESNIRKFLPVKTKVNKQLRETLVKEPEEVFYYNNGITIVVTDFEELGDKSIKLHAPQIVNGAQTSTTIADVVSGDPHINGSIQITIIKEDVRATRNNITRYRNSQNAVKGRDLISLERFHDSISLQLEQLGYYYEQQAGAWMALNEKQRKSYEGNEVFKKYLPYDHDKRIPASDAIQAMAAALEQDPAKAYGSVSKYMPGGTEYHKIFEEGKLDDNHRFLLYPYLIKSYCEKEFSYGTKKANMDEKKYARLLFVTAYFQTLTEHIMDGKVDIKKDPNTLDKYFTNYETNQKLLKLIDEILDEFFEHTLSIRQDEDGRDKMTLHNFFARHVWGSEARQILKSVIKRKREKLREIKESFK
ncbi:MAG: AIPR family protein [Nitrosopumilaceae archaeon]